MKKYWFCAVPAFLLLCGIGYFEIFGLPTGISTDLLRYALLGVSAVFILLIFLFGLRQNVVIREGRNIFGAVCSALLAIGVILRSIYNIYSLFWSKLCRATAPWVFEASTAAMMALRISIRHLVVGFFTCSQNSSLVQGRA